MRSVRPVATLEHALRAAAEVGDDRVRLVGGGGPVHGQVARAEPERLELAAEVRQAVVVGLRDRLAPRAPPWRPARGRRTARSRRGSRPPPAASAACARRGRCAAATPPAARRPNATGSGSTQFSGRGREVAAALRHELLREEDGVVLELGVGAEPGLQVLRRPERRAHEVGELLAVLHEQRLERVEPGVVHRRAPARRPAARRPPASASRAGCRSSRSRTHRPSSRPGTAKSEPSDGGEIERRRQQPRLRRGADVRVDELVEHVGVDHEARAEDSGSPPSPG